METYNEYANYFKDSVLSIISSNKKTIKCTLIKNTTGVRHGINIQHVLMASPCLFWENIFYNSNITQLLNYSVCEKFPEILKMSKVVPDVYKKGAIDKKLV